MKQPEEYLQAARDAQRQIVEYMTDLRKDAYLSQRQVAEILGLKQHTSISMIEQGKCTPSLTRVLQILAVYGYTLKIEKMEKQ